MSRCDTLLMIGSGFLYSEFLPKEGQARGVQIDLEPEMLNLRYPMVVSLVGDSRETCERCCPCSSKGKIAPGDATSRRMSPNGGSYWKAAP